MAAVTWPPAIGCIGEGRGWNPCDEQQSTVGCRPDPAAVASQGRIRVWSVRHRHARCGFLYGYCRALARCAAGERIAFPSERETPSSDRRLMRRRCPRVGARRLLLPDGRPSVACRGPMVRKAGQAAGRGWGCWSEQGPPPGPRRRTHEGRSWSLGRPLAGPERMAPRGLGLAGEAPVQGTVASLDLLVAGRHIPPRARHEIATGMVGENWQACCMRQSG